MIDSSRIDTLKNADVVHVAELLGLRGRGRRLWCPRCQADGDEHRTPDLSVGATGWKCHRCGEGGDALALVRAVTGETFPDAVERLEGLLGVAPAAPDRPGPSPRPAPRPAAPVAPPELYERFLEQCDPIEDAVLSWLESKAISAAVVEAAGLRFIGREFPEILERIAAEFPREVVNASGLPNLTHYHARQAGVVVFPYRRDGRTVALKCRPPFGKAEAERRDLRRFTQCGSLSVPFNVDALGQYPGADVLVCEGESDTLAAVSAGTLAIGVPGARGFKRNWLELLRGRRVTVAFDPDEAGQGGTMTIADLFETDGQPRPGRLSLPPGLDLSDYLAARRSVPVPEPEPEPAAVPSAGDASEMLLVDFGRSGLVLEVVSEVLGETVSFVADAYRPEPGDPIAYRADELDALLGAPAELVRLAHGVKRRFPGSRVAAHERIEA